MDKLFYEKMLQKESKDYGKMEARWDAIAKQFDRTQQMEKPGFPEKVMEILAQKEILKGAKVLDVGGGSGRYAIPLARQAESVTVTDISANMLECAEQNGKKAGLDNLFFKKMEWSSLDLEVLGWEKKFDLVFASMCPAVRSIKGLANMSFASKGYCLINQFITDSDSVADDLNEVLKVGKKMNPHNDRDAVQAYFNLLWMDGYEPTIDYMRSQEAIELSLEEAVVYYENRYGAIAKDRRLNLEDLLVPMVNKNKISIIREKTIAMILWKIAV